MLGVSQRLELSASDPAVDVGPESLTRSGRSNTLRALTTARPEFGSVEQGFEVGRNHALTEINVHTRRLQILNYWPPLLSFVPSWL
jgi:hypothetical protein